MNIPAMRRVATLAVAATLLGGCATMTDWFSGSDNAPKPTPLQAIQNSVTPKVRWDASLGASADYAFSPALMGDIVWAAGRDGQLVAVDVNTGRQVSRLDTRLPLSSGVGAKNGVLYVATSEGELVALNEDGKPRWRIRLTSQALESPQSDGQRVLVRTHDGRLSAFDVDSGKSLWTFQRPQPTLTVRNYGSTTLVGNEAALVGLPGGKLAAVGSATGDLLWEAPVSRRLRLAIRISLSAFPRSAKAVSISLKAASASLRSLLRPSLTLPTSIGVLAKSAWRASTSVYIVSMMAAYLF